jgi:hypothetical protein
MGAQGSGAHAEHHAGASMQQRHHMGNGETTPWQLAAGLANMLVQGGGIGPGKTGAIPPKGPMAQPPPLLKGCVRPGVAHRAEQLLEHRERELPARLTIGRGRDSHLREMAAEAYRPYGHGEAG